MYLAIFFAVFSLASCSDDDDGVIQIDPTAVLMVDDEQTLTANNTFTVQTVTVGQDSWLVAVNSGDENTDNFISDPVMVEEGTHTDVEVTLDADAVSDDGSGQEIVLKLYADNPTEGTLGEWDEFDEPILDDNDVLVTETITVFADNTMEFSDFDANSDGSLDATEVPNIYENNFEEWDADGDGSLSEEEFNNTTFSLTDMDDDDALTEEEWNDGFESFFGNWTEDDFATFDANADGSVTSDEWNTIFGDSEWFTTFDADENSMVTEDEWDAGLFDDWDANDDDAVDEDEFNVFAPFAGMW